MSAEVIVDRAIGVFLLGLMVALIWIAVAGFRGKL